MPGVYISFPFCGRKCSYCNFASGVFPKQLEEKYVDALCNEIARHGWGWEPETLYIGGGTPSDVDPESLERILAAVPGSPWREATLEASPGTVTEEKIRTWNRLGINRLSLGVQSFVSREIGRTGRTHTAETVRREIALLRNEGLTNFNIDLIAGLPGQTPQSWLESLEWVEKVEAPHVSVYMLEIDEDSRLGREILSGGSRYGASEAPPEDLTAEFYERAVEFLRGIGVYRYEISNFARPGRESVHNMKYWRLEPYVGFGADAHSFDGYVRSQNIESPAGYIERFEQGASPRVQSVAADRTEERFFVGLRLSAGIRPEADEWLRFDTPIRRFLSEGLLEEDGERLRLTARGVLLSNEVFKEFISI